MIFPPWKETTRGIEEDGGKRFLADEPLIVAAEEVKECMIIVEKTFIYVERELDG